MSRNQVTDDVHGYAEELRLAWSSSQWQHYKGSMYYVDTVVVDAASNEIVVVYQSQEHGRRWCRKLSDWQQRVNPTRENPDGVPRFQSL